MTMVGVSVHNYIFSKLHAERALVPGLGVAARAMDQAIRVD